MSLSSYYDIDAILAEEELLPCQTLFDFIHLAHLDPDCDKAEYLPQNTQLKLPLWAVEKWAQLAYIRITPPRHYGAKTRQRLEADPTDVDLRKKNPHYFMSGRRIVTLLHQVSRSSTDRRQVQVAQIEGPSIRQCLILTYVGARFRQTLDWSLSLDHDARENLTHLESQLYHSGAAAAAAWQQWKIAGGRATMILSRTKRRVVTPDLEKSSLGANKRLRSE